MQRETEGGRGWSKTVKGGQGWLRVLRRILGAPDYQAYLEHCRAGHVPALSEREYVAQFFEAKGKGVRCC
ncbi:MAG: hypothetical protein AUH78_17325 [Gemmatimonadetes bacterium 13_1_40CM_4_69_8]|nr:MAG: hypothetical protein AUH78_17325 [Gemmatimonadetes bacterium 13_1_40CM_4_69_8]